MTEFNEIRAKVTSSINVIIRATKKDINLNEPLYAINWFSTKSEWMYHLYNILAIRSVRKIGGKAIFKAKVKKTIIDEANGKRDLILIVRYPTGQNFKSLMESTYFKIVSVFRILSVSKFTFCFTHKLEIETESKKQNKRHFAVHHYKTEMDYKSILEQFKLLMPENISIKYSGYAVATLNKEEHGKPIEQIPNLMDAIIIYHANEEKTLIDFFADDRYKKIQERFQSSNISLLNRITV